MELRGWEQLQQHYQQQQQEQQQQQQALFLPESRRDVSSTRQSSSSTVFGGGSVLQGHGVLLFRNRPLGLRCGAVLSGWEQLQQHHQQQQQEQQQQAQQLQSLCFYQNPEGTSSLGTACFWRSFRPSGPWCFAVSQPPARTSLWSWGDGSSSSSTTTSSSSSSSSRPSSCNRFVFTRIQKGRQASGQHVFGGSVLQGHGVLLFRNRPLGLRCGAVLSGWEQLQQHYQQQQQQQESSSSRQPRAAAAIALFLPESRRDVKPRDTMFLEVVPSFRAMVFCCFATAR